MKKFDPKYFQDFKEAITSHNLISGEIILAIWEHDKNKFQINELLPELLKVEDLKIEDQNFKLEEISKKEAIESIKYGMSTKVNYTMIDREFSPSEQNQYAHGFLDFFTDCKYYITKSRLYHDELDLNDFWEMGGAIAIDNEKIGIFWINDLYDKF